MELKTIGVVGAGQMGSGIAQVAAQAGYQVLLLDASEEALRRGLEAIRRSLAKFLEKGRITEEALEAALGRIRTTLDLEALGEADLIVEAIVEDEGAKRALLERLGALAKPEAILASNTSSIPITALGRYSGRPERFIGMHFFNPVPLMQLVEVIRGELTSAATRDVVVEVARRMGKTPLEVQDYPGFVSNRLLMPMINEAVEALREGVATKEAIDGIMRLGMNTPWGLWSSPTSSAWTPAWPSWRSSTGASATTSTGPPPCFAAWSRRGCWGAKWAGGFTCTTKRGTG
jgi:3-hydroxybutyryl-CoA dehydrogenase